MTLWVRPAKAAGGTSYVDGRVLPASDLNGDIDAGVNVVNGNLEDENLSATAAVDPAKVDDFSATAAEAVTIADPGTTDLPIAATDLTGELTRLRYNDLYGGAGIAAQYNNGTSNATAGPWDGARVGHNLVQNGSLQLQTGGAGAAPNGWTLVNVPSVILLGAGDVSEGDVQGLNITGSGTADGITQTIAGLKESALYLIGCRAKAGVNAGSFAVTGGLASGAFKNTSRAIAVSGDYSTYSLLVKATATPDDIVITITTGATALDTISVHDVFMYEIAKDVRSQGSTTSQSVRLIAETDVAAASGAGDNWIAGPAGLSVSVRSFRNNQRVIYAATLNVSQAAGTISGLIRLTENGSVVAGPYPVPINVANTDEHAPVVFSYIKENPAPGTSLTYAFQVRQSDLVGRTYRFAELDGGADPIQRSCDINIRLEDC